MSQIEHHVTHATLEQRMASWGEQYKVKRGELNSMARAAYAFYLEWHAAGAVGDFSGILAEHSGLSRTTAWRVWRSGMAIAEGANPEADQMDLVQAAKALEHGAVVADVNEAIANDRIKDLADQLSVGTVGRSMDAEVADLREQVLQRLGKLGLEDVKAREREEIVYRAFLMAPESTLRDIIQAFRVMTEPSGGEA